MRRFQTTAKRLRSVIPVAFSRELETSLKSSLICSRQSRVSRGAFSSLLVNNGPAGVVLPRVSRHRPPRLSSRKPPIWLLARRWTFKPRDPRGLVRIRLSPPQARLDLRSKHGSGENRIRTTRLVWPPPWRQIAIPAAECIVRSRASLGESPKSERCGGTASSPPFTRSWNASGNSRSIRTPERFPAFHHACELSLWVSLWHVQLLRSDRCRTCFDDSYLAPIWRADRW